MGWAGLGVTLTRLLTPLLSRDNICKHCFYVLQFSGRNNEEDVGKSRPRWLHHRNLVTWGSNTLTFPQTLDLGLSPGVQRQPSSYCHRRSVENRGYFDRAPQWQNTFILIQNAFGHANCFRYVLCIVVYPRPWAVPWCCRGQCSVIYVSYWTRAGPKSGKLPRFWILRLQRDRGGQQRPRPPIWMVGCEHGHQATDTHYTSAGQLNRPCLDTILFFLGWGFVEYSSCKVYTHLKN